MKPLRILCVEDDPLVRETLVRMLATARHIVTHARDGLEAWEKIAKDISRFDVLITDHQLPQLTGLELIELLRQVGFSGRIIVFSGSLTPDDRNKYLGFKVDACLDKGASGTQLLEVVERLQRA